MIKISYYLIQLLEGLGTGAFFPIYTPWLELHGLNFFKMGYVNFIYHISAAILDPFTGFIADRFGKRKCFIIGQILWTATHYIYGVSSQIGGFLLAESIAAVGNSLKSDTLESWLQNKLGEKESSLVMGRSKIVFSIGQITTSILTGYVSSTYGMKTAWFMAGTFFLATTILGCIVLPIAGSDLPNNVDKHTHWNTSETNIKQILALTFSNKKIMFTAVLVAVFNIASKPMFMYWPQTVIKLGIPKEMIGWTILAISIPSMVGSLLAGRNKVITRDKYGLSKILIILSTGLIVASLANNLTIFILGLLMVEVACGATNIVTYGYLYNEVLPNHRSTVNSIISGTKTLGGAISLLIMGEIADLFSPQISFLVGGMMLLILFLYYIKRR